MSSANDESSCERTELVSAYVLHALPSGEAKAMQAHLSDCPDCQREIESLSSVVAALADWPTDVLRPSPLLRERLASRIAAELGGEPIIPPAKQWSEPDWEEVAPGI